MSHGGLVPAEDVQRLPRPGVPEPGRRVRGCRQDTRAIRREGCASESELVSFEALESLTLERAEQGELVSRQQQALAVGRVLDAAAPARDIELAEPLALQAPASHEPTAAGRRNLGAVRREARIDRVGRVLVDVQQIAGGVPEPCGPARRETRPRS